MSLLITCVFMTPQIRKIKVLISLKILQTIGIDGIDVKYYNLINTILKNIYTENQLNT